MSRLLIRQDFVFQALTRDNNCCVICKEAASEVHHIIERKLWSDSGYYLDNAATLCSKHHILAEQTLLSCEEIRKAAGIKSIILPEHLDVGHEYDKWGNAILSNGTRLRGEMFYTEQVQKILSSANLLNIFNKYVKYPRTYHFPHSYRSTDDKCLKDYSIFDDMNVVVTVKMDGENTTMYNDFVHARSINSGDHPSRNWIKGLWGRISYLLDDDMRLCGENMYAWHTIKYEDLESYFLLFSVWVKDTCLSWQETEEYAKILDLKTVPVIYSGKFDLAKIEEAFSKYHQINDNPEGYVVRNANEFKYLDFKRNVAKYVKQQFRWVKDTCLSWLLKLKKQK